MKLVKPIVITLLLSAAASVDAQTSSRGNAEKPAFSLSVSALPAHVSPGEPIQLTVSLVNNSRDEFSSARKMALAERSTTMCLSLMLKEQTLRPRHTTDRLRESVCRKIRRPLMPTAVRYLFFNPDNPQTAALILVDSSKSTSREVIECGLSESSRVTICC